MKLYNLTVFLPRLRTAVSVLHALLPSKLRSHGGSSTAPPQVSSAPHVLRTMLLSAPYGGSLATPPSVDLLLTSWRHCVLLHSVDFLSSPRSGTACSPTQQISSFLNNRTYRAPTRLFLQPRGGITYSSTWCYSAPVYVPPFYSFSHPVTSNSPTLLLSLIYLILRTVRRWRSGLTVNIIRNKLKKNKSRGAVSGGEKKLIKLYRVRLPQLSVINQNLIIKIIKNYIRWRIQYRTYKYQIIHIIKLNK